MAGGFLILFIFGSISTLQENKEEGEVPVQFCYVDYHYIMVVDQNGCDRLQKEADERKVKKNESAVKIFCFYYGSYCRSDSQTFMWNDLEDSWEETEDSKLCSKYYLSKLSDLPVACLGYYGVKK